MPLFSARRLSRAFADSLSTQAATPRARILGLEHEYQVRCAGRQVDFGRMIDRLDLGTRYLHPAVPSAYYRPSGSAISSDGAEAEIALPPMELRPGFARRMEEHAAGERVALDELLPPGCRLDGYSTHLSVSMPSRLAHRVAPLYARTFAPALMLLMDGPRAPGLLVRPRTNRIEFGASFVDGPNLRGAVAFAVASATAPARWLGIKPKRCPLPVLEVALQPAVVRHGWYVDRSAFGCDLYGAGRKARLVTTRGTTITAQDLLELAWGVARPVLAPLVGPDDLTVVNQMIAGSRPLPCESGDDPAESRSVHAAIRTTLGDAITPRRRPTFKLAPVMLTWDTAVFVVMDRAGSRRAFANVPALLLGSFLRQLDRGDLDGVIDTYLSRPSAGRRLTRHRQTMRPGLYDRLGARAELVAREPQRPLPTSWTRGLARHDIVSHFS